MKKKYGDKYLGATSKRAVGFRRAVIELRTQGRKLFWPVLSIEKTDKIRGKYKTLKEWAAQGLSQKEAEHGNYTDIVRAYNAIHGYKYREPTGKKLFKTKKVTVKGILDVLEDAKKLEKLGAKPGKLSQHIEDVRALHELISRIEGDVKPGAFRTEFQPLLRDYLARLGQLQAGAIDADAAKLTDIAALIKSAKGHKGKISDANRLVGEFANKRDAYEGVEHFGNAMSYWKLSRLAEKPKQKQIAALDKRLKELDEKRMKKMLTDKEITEITRTEAELKALIAEAKGKGTIITMRDVQLAPNTTVQVVFIPENRESDWLKEQKKVASRGQAKAIASYGVFTLAALASTIASWTVAKISGLKAASAAESAANRQMQDNLAYYQGRDAEWQAAYNSLQGQQGFIGPTPPGQPEVIPLPITTPAMPPTPPHAGDFLPAQATGPLGATGTAGTVAAAMLGVPAAAIIGTLGPIFGVSAVGAYLMRRGELIGKIRQAAADDPAKLIRPLDVTGMRGPEKSLVEKDERQTIDALKRGGYKADYIPTTGGTIVVLRPGAQPQAI